jgi:hypothetical protein
MIRAVEIFHGTGLTAPFLRKMEAEGKLSLRKI